MFCPWTPTENAAEINNKTRQDIVDMMGPKKKASVFGARMICEQSSMRFTPEQEAALQSEDHVVIDAPPGTGKTRILIEFARRAIERDQRVVALAYNTELAAELEADLRDQELGDVQCYTFHGMCSQRAQLARDDDDLENIVESIEAGDVEYDPVEADVLMLDEAQDVTALHLRLIAAIIARPVQRLIVVGDPRQRLYDYGVHPALTHQFETPDTTFGAIAAPKPWTRHKFTTSHRITPGMTRLVHTMFGLDLASAKTAPGHVVLHACGPWDLGHTILDIVRDSPIDDTVVMAASKTGNAPLRTAVNHLSESGIPLFVQGVDPPDTTTRRGKLRISSYHAAKGSEFDVAIVVAPSARWDHVTRNSNAMYVALTRARKKLHIVALRGDVDIEFVDAVRASGARVENALTPAECATPLPRPQRFVGQRPVRVAILARTRTRCRAVTPGYYTCTPREGSVHALAALCNVEYTRTGRVRAVDDALDPPRLPREQVDDAIRAGHMGRFVAPTARMNALLAPDLRKALRDAYASKRGVEDWCTCACGVRAWNAYQHAMRQLLPARDWADANLHTRYCELIQDVIVELDAQFDVRLRRVVDGVVHHRRVHASTATSAYHIVSDKIGAADRDDATVRAALHPSGFCTLVSLETGQIDDVRVDDETRNEILNLARL